MVWCFWEVQFGISVSLNVYEPRHEKTKKNGTCVQRRLRSASASTQSDQSLRCALSVQLRTQTFFMRTSKTLIRLCGCPGWSKPSLGAHAILLVLSWGGSYTLILSGSLCISVSVEVMTQSDWNVVESYAKYQFKLTNTLFSVRLLIPSYYQTLAFTSLYPQWTLRLKSVSVFS